MNLQQTIFELRCPHCSFSCLLEIKWGVLIPHCDEKVLQTALTHTCKPDRFSFVGNRAREKAMAAQSKAAAVKLDLTKKLTEHREKNELLQAARVYDNIVSNWEQEFNE
jgi:hypothetical protein